MQVGDRVRVRKSVIMYHHPEHRNQPFEMMGQEGTVAAVVRDWHGRPVTANLPVEVQFSEKFKAHFQEAELESLAPD